MMDGDFLELGIQPALSPMAKIAQAFESLDQVIRRRTSVKQPRNRKVTLTDLIAELKKYEALEKKRRLKETVERASQRRIRNYSISLRRRLWSWRMKSLLRIQFCG